MEGYFKERAMAELESCDDDVREPLGNGLYLQRNKVRSYYTEDFVFCVRAWRWAKDKMLLPYRGGWAEQPADLVEIMEQYDAIYDQYLSRQPTPGAGRRR